MNDIDALHAKLISDIRNRISELGLTDAEVGFRARIAQSAISRLFHGDHVPSLSTLVRVANALGLRIEVVFTATDGEA